MQVPSTSPEESSSDQGPHLNVVEDRRVTTIDNGQTADIGYPKNDDMAQHDKAEDAASMVAAIGNGPTTHIRSLKIDNFAQHDKAEGKISDTGNSGETSMWQLSMLYPQGEMLMTSVFLLKGV